MPVNAYIRTSSIDVDGNINFKRFKERRSYNRWLLGTALRSDLGHESVTNNLTTRPPSWTQTDLNLNHSFVIEPLSSSYHEVQSLNSFLSGVSALETSPVPASSSLFYSKKQLTTAVYKLSASAATPGNSNTGTSFSSLSGSRFVLDYDASSSIAGYREGAPNCLKTFTIDVPDFGKIVDVKVWVEWVSNTTSNEFVDDSNYDLGSAIIALRSPNVRFESGYPIRNDSRIPLALEHTNLSGGLKTVYRNSYILWDGDENKITAPFLGTFHTGTSVAWNGDFSMRTIFWDSSPVYNPRHLNPLYKNGSSDHNYSQLTASSPKAGYNNTFSVNSSSIPWLSDARVLTTAQDGGLAGSPPSGWLNGPGGTNDVNEWPTTGSNWGPETIKPVYPLLDDILEIRPSFSGSTKSTTSYVGFRPGLRGTEIHGKWELLFATPTLLVGGLTRHVAWFRQFRLEFVYEKYPHGRPLKELPRTNPSHNSSTKPRLLFVLSGSSVLNSTPDLDKSVENLVYDANNLNFYGLTTGITDDTGSLNSNNYAVFTRITGALAEAITGSQHAHYRYKFLNNEFGTPFLSILSGSGYVDDIPATTFDRTLDDNHAVITSVFSPAKIVGSGNTMRSLLSKKQTTTKLRDLVPQTSAIFKSSQQQQSTTTSTDVSLPYGIQNSSSLAIAVTHDGPAYGWIARNTDDGVAIGSITSGTFEEVLCGISVVSENAYKMTLPTSSFFNLIVDNAGVYDVRYGISVAPDAVAKIYTALFDNATELTGTRSYAILDAGYVGRFEGNAIVPLAAGDRLNIRVSSATTTTVGAANFYMSARQLISPFTGSVSSSLTVSSSLVY